MQQRNNIDTQPIPQYQPQYPQYPLYCPYCKEKLEVKPTFSLVWGIMWRMWVIATPIYAIILILQLALK